MTGIVVLTIVGGLLVYWVWQTTSEPAPDDRLECCLCGSTKRSLQWMKSWEDWYCWPCKEKRIHAILHLLIEEHS